MTSVSDYITVFSIHRSCTKLYTDLIKPTTHCPEIAVEDGDDFEYEFWARTEQNNSVKVSDARSRQQLGNKNVGIDQRLSVGLFYTRRASSPRRFLRRVPPSLQKVKLGTQQSKRFDAAERKIQSAVNGPVTVTRCGKAQRHLCGRYEQHMIASPRVQFMPRVTGAL